MRCILLTIGLAVWFATAWLGAAHAQAAAAEKPAVAAAITDAMQAPGPRLTVDPEMLADALECYPASDDTRAGVVLLVHGTGLTAKASWQKTYVPALTANGYGTCTIKLPMRALADAQVSSEYVVSAVRTLYQRLGDSIDVVTHSQGALEARWAIRFWPDIADKIDDLVMLSGSNHGTLVANIVCLQKLKGCTESVAQQRPRSRFLVALNNGDETPAGVDYTSIYSYTDEIVTTSPVNPAPALVGAVNVAVQDICPGRPVMHIPMITDAVSYALARDALDHDGPARPGRIDRKTTCARLVAPDMTPVDALINASTYLPAGASIFLTRGMREPRLKPYAQSALPEGYRSPSSRPIGALLDSSVSLLR